MIGLFLARLSRACRDHSAISPTLPQRKPSYYYGRSTFNLDCSDNNVTGGINNGNSTIPARDIDTTTVITDGDAVRAGSDVDGACDLLVDVLMTETVPA
jgi:hypothetical protein